MGSGNPFGIAAGMMATVLDGNQQGRADDALIVVRVAACSGSVCALHSIRVNRIQTTFRAMPLANSAKPAIRQVLNFVKAI
jgi:hypothetical protein